MSLIIDNYLPWLATLPEECRQNNKSKKSSKNDVVSIAEILLIYTTPSFDGLTFYKIELQFTA